MQNKSITWLLMLWWCNEPGHQQPWYWLYKKNMSMIKHFFGLRHLKNLEKWYQRIAFTFFPKKAREGFTHSETRKIIDVRHFYHLKYHKLTLLQLTITCTIILFTDTGSLFIPAAFNSCCWHSFHFSRGVMFYIYKKKKKKKIYIYNKANWYINFDYVHIILWQRSGLVKKVSIFETTFSKEFSSK